MVADLGADGLRVEEKSVGARPARELRVGPSAGDAVPIRKGEVCTAPSANDGQSCGFEGRTVGRQFVALSRDYLVEAWLAVVDGSVAVASGRVEDGRRGAGLEPAGAVGFDLIQDRLAGSAKSLRI